MKSISQKEDVYADWLPLMISYFITIVWSLPPIFLQLLLW